MEVDFLLIMASPPSASTFTPPPECAGPCSSIPLAAFGTGAAAAAANCMAPVAPAAMERDT